MSGDFLEQMAASSRARSAAAQARIPESELRARIADLPAAPKLELGAFDLIAEVKLRSPAVGLLKAATDEDVGARVAAYARAGAAAVSILTEPSRFDGSLDDLAAGARALAPLGVPAMRKDFLVDGYQVLEGRVAGASGVLAILRMLPRVGAGTIDRHRARAFDVRAARSFRCAGHRACACAGRCAPRASRSAAGRA